MNANDRGFYRSLEVAVRKECDEKFNPDAIKAAVHRAWTKYDPDTLAAMYRTKTRVMGLVLSDGGGNGYDSHARSPP